MYNDEQITTYAQPVAKKLRISSQRVHETHFATISLWRHDVVYRVDLHVCPWSMSFDVTTYIVIKVHV